jgi:hypothetical protein
MEIERQLKEDGGICAQCSRDYRVLNNRAQALGRKNKEFGAGKWLLEKDALAKRINKYWEAVEKRYKAAMAKKRDASAAK